MKSVLYQMYTGILDPSGEYEPLLKEHKNLLQNRRNCFDRVIAELDKVNPTLKRSFELVLDKHYTETYFNTAQMYMDGFRLGVKMMVEVYQSDWTKNND